MKTSSFTKSYNGNTVLSLPDLELRPGTIYAILGANGAGKSTMLRILGGLEKADHGNAALKNVSAGFLPQKPFALYMSTLRNLLSNSDRDEKSEVRARNLLRTMRLDGLEDQNAKSLSGGETARMALCRLLMRDYEAEHGRDIFYLEEDDQFEILNTVQEELKEERKMDYSANAGQFLGLPYNLEFSNTWKKDFQRTAYLGGSIQGDWNPAVTRDMSANTVIIAGPDVDRQLSMRSLAGYAGPAHVRTPDGSSFACDIQVRESQDYKSSKVSYSLTIQAIDPQAPEGMTLEEWQAMHPVS